MPRPSAKLISAVVKPRTRKSLRAKSRRLARQVVHGTLLAVTIAATRLDVEEQGGAKKRLFDVGLLDRLRAPITRYHE